MISRSLKIPFYSALALVAMLLVIAGSIYLADHFYFTSIRDYESYWDIDLPDRAEELYDIDTGGFDGDGIRYTVYAVSADDPFLANLNRQPDGKLEENITDMLTAHSIHMSAAPDFSVEYYWGSKGKSENVLILIYGQGKLYCLSAESPFALETK